MLYRFDITAGSDEDLSHGRTCFELKTEN
jgi:hypothetical protein